MLTFEGAHVAGAEAAHEKLTVTAARHPRHPHPLTCAEPSFLLTNQTRPSAAGRSALRRRRNHDSGQRGAAGMQEYGAVVSKQS